MVVDIVTNPDPAVIDQLYLDRLRSAEPVTATGKITRFRIGAGENVHGQRLSEVPIELPRFDYARVAGRPYRYVYGAGNEVPGNFIDNLVKLDLDGGTASSWHEEGCYPGEPVFVPAPERANEDNGVILSVVLDTHKAASFLLILDAATFREPARAYAPHHIPFGFHGGAIGDCPCSFPARFSLLAPLLGSVPYSLPTGECPLLAPYWGEWSPTRSYSLLLLPLSVSALEALCDSAQWTSAYSRIRTPG